MKVQFFRVHAGGEGGQIVVRRIFVSYDCYISN